MCYCNFCGKNQALVKKVIEAENKKTHICDECVATCVSTLCDLEDVKGLPQLLIFLSHEITKIGERLTL